MQHLADNLRTLRLLRGYSQTYLAAALGISQSYYAKLENNRAVLKVPQLLQLAALLEVAPGHLLAEDLRGRLEAGIGRGER
ncbi:MAG: helix-turn-helix transcriptional regulator [Lewinella sp.]|nr:helix-turn-helix transcriptional regulator [Lewinella sp.]